MRSSTCVSGGTYHLLDLLVTHQSPDGLAKVSHRFPMIFLIVRSYRVRSEDDVIVHLVSVNGGSSNASVRVNASEYHMTGAARAQEVCEMRSKEGAVSLLYDFTIRIRALELAKDLAALRVCDRDTRNRRAQRQVRVAEIRTALPSDADDRAASKACEAGEFIHGIAH